MFGCKGSFTHNAELYRAIIAETVASAQQCMCECTIKIAMPDVTASSETEFRISAKPDRTLNLGIQ